MGGRVECFLGENTGFFGRKLEKYELNKLFPIFQINFIITMKLGTRNITVAFFIKSNGILWDKK